MTTSNEETVSIRLICDEHPHLGMLLELHVKYSASARKWESEGRLTLAFQSLVAFSLLCAAHSQEWYLALERVYESEKEEIYHIRDLPYTALGQLLYFDTRIPKRLIFEGYFQREKEQLRWLLGGYECWLQPFALDSTIRPINSRSESWHCL